MIKLKDILKEFSGADSAGNSDNGGIWAPPGKERKLPDGMIKGWVQIDMGPKADNPFSENTEWREDTHDITIPGGYYSALESDDFITAGIGKKGENFIQKDTKKQDIEAKGRNVIKERSLKLKDILAEALPKNKWVQLRGKDFKEFASEIFDMIKQSYASIGGHPNIKSASDINPSDINYWEVIDIDQDPEPDAVSGAKNKSAGRKYTLGATDGSSKAKRSYVGSRIKALKSSGNYAELSHKIADIMKSAGVPIVDDEEMVRKVLRKDINWLGDGYYERKIGGKTFKKRLFGNPKV